MIGRLPPAGRDLDVLVRAPTEEPIRRALLESGYIEHADQWARFHSATVDSLNYARASTWNLPVAELDALFDEGVPVAGFEDLARPAGHHALLILARQVVLGRGRLRDKHRHRVDAVLADDPGAWDTAAARAPFWRAERALAGLREAYERGVTLPVQARAPAIADWLQAGGRHPARARLRAWRIATKRRPRGRVITFSGLDGAGKSTQAAALAHTLERLGFEVALEWTRLGPTTLTRPIFGILAWPVRRVLRMRGQRGAAAERPPSGGVVEFEDPAILAQTRALRERSSLLTAIWITLVVVAHASAQRRATRPHVRAGRLVVCDRYTLDSTVDLRYHYGSTRAFRWQERLIGLLSPTPWRSYFLDIAPETSLARKLEQWQLEDLLEHARLFRLEYAAHGARRLDGERPPAELNAEIAREIWTSLR